MGNKKKKINDLKNWQYVMGEKVHPSAVSNELVMSQK